MRTETAIKPFPYSHCHQCGTPYEHANWPRQCPSCNDLRWHNPTPIGVMLQTVTDGTRIGVLTPVRGHGPQLGCEGLTGGFEEASDDGVDAAGIREYREEIHRENDVRREDVEIIRSRGSGPLYPPGKRQSLTFSVNPVPVHVDEFKNWVPDAETSAIEFSWEPKVLAFPTHTLAMAEYFRRYQGIQAPSQYFEQPVTGDDVNHEGARYPVFNVVYDQPLLDEGIWRVQLEQDGALADVRLLNGDWELIGLGPVGVSTPMPDRESIEQIKRDWILDPHWDLESTDGFEAVRPELAAFVSVKQAQWKRDREARLVERALQLGCSPQLAQYVNGLEDRLGRMETMLRIRGF